MPHSQELFIYVKFWMAEPFSAMTLAIDIYPPLLFVRGATWRDCGPTVAIAGMFLGPPYAAVAPRGL